ncbi:hypothetical protein ACFL2Z_02350 [Candidatus Eisenbacteria bacterium]|uniref:DUF3996 domain-containing protein n=1 Tax=Eiseniibacteriota bacterium TaxID=2212470 RepID=A0ABV6YNT7_UNCEI
MRTLSVLMLLAVLLTLASAAFAGDFGLGIILGEPTGISFKQWLTERNAIDAAAAWSFGNVSAFHVHMDYLYHGPLGADVDPGGMLYYVGIGARLKATEGDSRIGVRLPLGLDYVFDDTPIDIFFEIAPILDLAPSTDFRMNGSLGLRYFF